MKVQRHLVNARGILPAEHRIRRDGAEEGDLVLQLSGNVLLRAAEQHVGLDSKRPEFLHAVLGGFRLQFARRLDEGHIGQVHVDGVGLHAIVKARLELPLADGFQEGLALDVAHGAADFHQDDIHILGYLFHGALDFIRDVRDHLHGLAQVVAAALFLDDGVVDPAGGDGMVPRCGNRRETFVVAKIQIGFRAVVGDENLAVLERRHGARIHVQVGVHLHERDFQPPRFQQCSK